MSCSDYGCSKALSHGDYKCLPHRVSAADGVSSGIKAWVFAGAVRDPIPEPLAIS